MKSVHYTIFFDLKQKQKKSPNDSSGESKESLDFSIKSHGGSEQFQIFQKFYKEKPLFEEDFLRKMNSAESPHVF